MLQASISYFSVAVNDLNTANKILLLYIGKGSITYAIVEEQVIIGFEKYSFNTEDAIVLEEFFTTKKWLTTPYQKVTIAYGTTEATVVPYKYYDANNNDAILATLYNIANAKSYSTNNTMHQVNVVYRIAKDSLRKIISIYPTATFTHYQKIVVDNYTNFDAVKLVLHCTEDNYVITLYQQARLLLSKTFAVSSNTLLSYQLLSICKMYGLTPDEVQLEISGWITEPSPLYQELYKYFLHIQLDKSSATLTIKNTEYEKHFFKMFDYMYAIN